MSSDPGVLPESRCPQCGQPLPKSEEWKRRRFRWGMLLAVLTFLPYGVVFESAFQSISAAKTTGLGAVAGGFSEMLVMFGIPMMILSALVAIFLLASGFSTKSALRMVGSILGIAWSALALIFMIGSIALLMFTRRLHG